MIILDFTLSFSLNKTLRKIASGESNNLPDEHCDMLLELGLISLSGFACSNYNDMHYEITNKGRLVLNNTWRNRILTWNSFILSVIAIIISIIALLK